jgi:hypothetical protein
MNLHCPHCRQPVAVPDHAAGVKVACPLCQNIFVAPRPAAAEVLGASALPPPAPQPEPPQPEPPQQPAAGEAPPHRVTLRLTPPVLRRVLLACFALLLVLLFLPWERVLLPSLLGAADRPDVAVKNLALVLDCGASMNERLPDGEVKVQTLRRVVGGLIDQLPDEVRVAMLLYGRDRETPCKVEVVHKLGPLDAAARAEVKGALGDVSPSGQAPMADALRQAGEELAAEAGGGGIVLITDGLDTCGGDPSARAAALAERRGLGYGVNIIGFGVAPRDMRALRGTALAGKGRFHDAQTPSELSEAVDAVLADARKSVERERLLGAVGGGRQSGLRIAFGSGPVPMAPLTALYVALTVLGLVAAAALLVLGRRAAAAGPLAAWLPRAAAAVSAAALLVLLLQLIVGFPVENHFPEQLFAYRTSWLSAAVFVSIIAVLAALLLVRVERGTPGRPAPRLEVAW